MNKFRLAVGLGSIGIGSLSSPEGRNISTQNQPSKLSEYGPLHTAEIAGEIGVRESTQGGSVVGEEGSSENEMIWAKIFRYSMFGAWFCKSPSQTLCQASRPANATLTVFNV